MVKTSPKYCLKCKYRWGGINMIMICDYILKTGQRRGCPVGFCDKFEECSKEENNNIPWDELSKV